VGTGLAFSQPFLIFISQLNQNVMEFNYQDSSEDQERILHRMENNHFRREFKAKVVMRQLLEAANNQGIRIAEPFVVMDTADHFIAMNLN